MNQWYRQHGAFSLGLLLVLASLTVSTQDKKIRGLDPKNMDLSVQPCDDFFQYSNGAWLKSTPIPPAFSSWGSFTELSEKNNDVLHQILEESARNRTAANGTNLQRIGDYYATGMDSAQVESLGARPLAPFLDRIAKIKDIAGVQTEIANLHREGLGGVFGFGATQDAKNSVMMIGQLGQGGLGMPDRDYYISDDDRLKKNREEYVGHMVAMFKLAGDDQATAEATAKSVLAVETRFAKASWTRVERRNPDKNYNKMTQQQLGELMPNFAWTTFFTALGVDNPGDVNVGQPPFFKEVDKMFADVPVNDWKAYLRWRVISGTANLLSSAFVAENFRFSGTVLTGAKEMQARWKRINAQINGLLGDAIGQLYVDRAFPASAKERAKEMVKNLLAAMKEHIQTRAWMDDVTRQAALKKLSTFGVKIGYPDKWRDYTGLEINRQSYFENARRASAFNIRRNLSRLGKAVDKTEWGFTTPTVNASYSPTRNEITFPAGILQPPFFDPEADDAVNYGGMGAVIGHEVSHGFDDQGSKFDADGNLKNWWSEGTQKQFEQRTGLVVSQFDGFVVVDSLHVNGKLTLGENIGDLGGLSIAYTALQHALEGKPRTKIDGFTPEQRFFLAWAQIWRRKSTPEALRLQVRTDPHSWARFRTNGPLANLKEFYEAFGCTDGPMVRPEGLRAEIW